MTPFEHLNAPVVDYARKDIPLLNRSSTIDEAISIIRQQGIGEKIIYFYVVDEDQRLVGVLPTRRLLTARLEEKLEQVMIPRVIAIPSTATLLDACEMFVLHKFLAFPIVDPQRRIIGVVDINLFTEEVMSHEEPDPEKDVFETLGFHIARVRNANPLRTFKYRFPWLLATLTSGTCCAVLAGAFEATLAQSLVLAFFLTMVLGVSESVSVQSMTLTIQALHVRRPTFAWYFRAAGKELLTASLLGLSCGFIVGMVVWFWRGDASAAIAIGLSVLASMITACWLGLSMPSLLHALRLDPKVAAGPVTLAATDLLTILFYLGIGTVVLR